MTTGRAATAAALTLAAALLARPCGPVTAAPGAPGAPQRLADTGLYADGRLGAIAEDVRPFAPQYPLWSDGATKSRWVLIPQGAAIDASVAADWEFPVGTRFWKEFRFGGRPVETRFIWRATTDSWVFAAYAWNAEGTEAVLAPERGLAGVAPVAGSATRRHSIPAVSDCLACHGESHPGPLGFNALQLSEDRDPNALHAEPLAPGMWTMRSLVAAGRLRASSSTQPIVENLRIGGDATTRTVLGYLSTNCGSCHQPGAGVPLLGASLRPSDVLDADRTLRAMRGHLTDWQVPGVPEGRSRLIDPKAPDDSALLRRARSRRPSSQMPPLGTVAADERAIDLIRDWIAGGA